MGRNVGGRKEGATTGFGTGNLDLVDPSLLHPEAASSPQGPAEVVELEPVVGGASEVSGTLAGNPTLNCKAPHDPSQSALAHFCLDGCGVFLAISRPP